MEIDKVLAPVVDGLERTARRFRYRISCLIPSIRPAIRSWFLLAQSHIVCSLCAPTVLRASFLRPTPVHDAGSGYLVLDSAGRTSTWAAEKVRQCEDRHVLPDQQQCQVSWSPVPVGGRLSLVRDDRILIRVPKFHIQTQARTESDPGDTPAPSRPVRSWCNCVSVIGHIRYPVSVDAGTPICGAVGIGGFVPLVYPPHPSDSRRAQSKKTWWTSVSAANILGLVLGMPALFIVLDCNDRAIKLEP